MRMCTRERQVCMLCMFEPAPRVGILHEDPSVDSSKEELRAAYQCTSYGTSCVTYRVSVIEPTELQGVCHMVTWSHGHMVTWAHDHMVTWAHGHMVI